MPVGRGPAACPLRCVSVIVYEAAAGARFFRETVTSHTEGCDGTRHYPLPGPFCMAHAVGEAVRLVPLSASRLSIQPLCAGARRCGSGGRYHNVAAKFWITKKTMRERASAGCESPSGRAI